MRYLLFLFCVLLQYPFFATEYKGQFSKYINKDHASPEQILKTTDSILASNKNLSVAERFELVNYQGNSLLNKYAYNLAYHKFYSALELISKIDSSDQIKQKLKANLLNTIGNIMVYQGLYSVGLNYYNEALHIYNELKNISGQAICLNNLGYVYETQKLYLKAKYNYKKAYILNVFIKNRAGEAMNLANIGAIYEAQHKYDSALYYNYKSLSIRKLLNDPIEIAACYNAIGQIYLNTGKYNKAIQNFQFLLKLSDYEQNKYPLAVTYKNIADYYSKLNNTDSCIFYYSKALKISEELKSYNLIYENSYNLSKQYAKIKKYKDAYRVGQISEKAKDTLSQQQTLQEISKMELRNDFDIKQKNLEIKQRKKEFIFYVLIISLISIIIIITLLILRQKLKLYNKNLEEQNLLLEKQLLQKEVENKTKELTTNTLYLAKKNEILSRLEKQLHDVNKQSTNEAEKKFRIHEMITTVKNNTNENAWKDFEIRFNEVHINFYENLLKIHPKISLNEKRLCAFLRLNMTTKEISAITQQTPHSINIARFRLRKKLGLKPDESLENFLAAF